MLIGYARVSTAEQSLDLQTDALRTAGCDRLFTDLASGAQAERPGLEAALDLCREGDTLVVWKLDRLGRSLPHLVETVRDLGRRGIAFRSLRESLDTASPGGKLVFHLFAALAEFERDVIRERTQAGLQAARARGRQGGRPPGVNEAKRQAALALKRDTTRSVREICSILGISRNTYYKYTRAADRPAPVRHRAPERPETTQGPHPK
jgi:DNA invertase Pin-like site-specific DNA recombinase